MSDIIIGSTKKQPRCNYHWNNHISKQKSIGAINIAKFNKNIGQNNNNCAWYE